MVGCSAFGGCQALNRTPATYSPTVSVGLSGTATPLQARTYRSGDPARHPCLHPLGRGIDIARGAAGRRILAQHVPGLQRVPQFQLHAAQRRPSPICGKRNSTCGSNQAGSSGKPSAAEFVQHFAEILQAVMRQQKIVVQPRAPAHHAGAHTDAARTPPPPRASAASGRPTCGHAAASRRRGTRPGRAGPPGPCGIVHLVDAELGAVGVAGHVRQDVAEQPVGQPGRRWRGTGRSGRRRFPAR